MKNLVKHVQDVNSQKKMWQPTDVIIAGVSGGPDSMCMVDVLRKIAKKIGLTIVIAHVNYGLRGNDSINDEKLVQKYAQKYKIDCKTLVCEKKSSGSENEWRNIRYDFFKKTAKTYKTNKIAVAHTKNDQAETLLGHLIRGSGLQGLSGMRQNSNMGIIRPLLTVARSDVLKYCKENNISYNIDKTNKDIVFMRNRLRNKLIPELVKSYNPKIIDTLANTAIIIADDQNFLESLQEKFWHEKDGVITFSTNKFLSKHPSQQRLALRTIIEQLRGSLVDIESGFIEELRKVISGTKNKHQFIYTKDLKMMKNNDTVEFMKMKTNL